MGQQDIIDIILNLGGTARRVDICRRSGKWSNNVDLLLRRLVRGGVVKRIERGVYQLVEGDPE